MMQWIDDLLEEARNIAKGVTRFQLKQYKPPLSRAVGTLPPTANTPPAQMPGGGFTPADGSVTTAKIADGAVTTGKLAFDPATQAELDAHIADDAAHPQYLLLSSVSLTPGANIVPRAGVAGKLATGWIPLIDLPSMVSGTLPIANGGTGATTAVAAMTALGGVRNAGNVVSIQAGLDLGRPTVGTAGRIYLATDTLRIYRDNGTTWQVIGSVQLTDQLGELSDTQHGTRGGGLLHATATTASNGFMSAADKAKLDGVGAGAQVASVGATGPLASSGGSAPTISIQNQAANHVLVGPAVGLASAPAFRILVAADIPTLDASKIGTGTLADARLSTNMARLDTAQTFTTQQVVGVSTGNTQLTGPQLIMERGTATPSGANPATNAGRAHFTMGIDSGNNAGIELHRGKTGSGAQGIACYIDFGFTDDADYDARLLMQSATALEILGGANFIYNGTGSVGIKRTPTAAGCTLDVTTGIGVNGTKVIGTRGAAITAPAATIADCQRAINDIIARMQGHGLIS